MPTLTLSGPARPLLAVLACACAPLLPATPALAESGVEATIRPAFHPDRLGSETSLTVATTLSGGGIEEEIPPPLRRMVLDLPAGFSIDIEAAGTCAAGALARGPSGCPAKSRIGHGSALVEVHAGSQSIPEEATVWAFRAGDRGGHPAMLILSRGVTPLYQQTISTGVLTPARSPYSAKLTISIPKIPTVMYEPDASILSMSLTVGASRAAPVELSAPRSCPAGGFPFAAQFSFEEASGASASASVPCP